MSKIRQEKLFGDDSLEIAPSNSLSYDNFDYKPSLLDKVKPHNRKQKIKKAIDYFWGNGLLYRIIKSKVDLTVSGFKVIHNDDKLNKKYQELNKELDIETFVKRLLFQYFTVGEYYPYDYWRGNKPMFLTLLNPELVTTETALGNDFIYMKPSNSIRRIMNRNDQSTKELKKIMPNELYQQWKKGKEAYLENAKRYSNLRQYHEQYAHLPIEPIFNELQTMETLQEADYATARKLRQLILHVKVGGKDFNQGNAVDQKILNKLKEYFEDNNLSRSMEMFTQYFVEMDYIHPDIEIFSSEKYSGVKESIVDWSNMGFLLDGSSSYSESSERIKTLKEELEEARNMVKKTLNSVYKKYAKRNGLTYFKEYKTPKIIFTKSPLMDEELLFKISKFLYNSGLLSIDDILDRFGYDKETQIKKKLEEKEFDGILTPVFQPNQGLLEMLYKENGVVSEDNDLDD